MKLVRPLLLLSLGTCPSAAFSPASSVGVATPRGTDSGAATVRPRVRSDRAATPFQGQRAVLRATAAAGIVGRMAPILSPVRRHANLLLALLAAAVASLFAKRASVQSLLWPGAQSDAAYSENPLPEGSLGCPFLGHPGLFAGSKEHGPFAGLGKVSRKFGNVFKTYSLGMPLVSISGMDNIQSALKYEFGPDGIDTYIMGEKNLGEIMGGEGILYEGDNDKHTLLRRIVGKAMSPAAIGAAIPSIEEAASIQIDRILEADAIEMETVFNDYTLDIAWKQILGLELTEEEVPDFHRNVEMWTSKIMDPLLLLPFRIPGLMTLTKVGRARTYLVTKVEEKLAKLDRDGPDDSTLSKLYFATDEDGTTKLTRTQVIHNALLLILAGSETSASTLTCATLLLGLHPNVWEKIKEEQCNIRAEHGDKLTPKVLERCTYLDAVIKETLRIKPPESQEARKVSSTIVVDGKQIPKGWSILLNIKQTHATDPVVYEEDMSHMDINKGFVPERWLDESTKPSAWLPFGEGRRRCIGERLAGTEMKIFLSMLARRVDRFELLNDLDKTEWKKDTLMARPLDGTEVRAYAAA